jgi:hypothetical protein
MNRTAAGHALSQSQSQSQSKSQSQRLPLAMLCLMLLVLAAAIGLQGCATIAGPRQVDVPIEKLQESLARRFPLRQRYLEVLDVGLTNPRLQMQPETGRVNATLDATIAPLFMKRSYNGSFTISGRLVIDPAHNAVVLREARMEKLTIDGVDDKVTTQLARISGTIAERTLGNAAIYTFEPDKLRYAGVQYSPNGITPTARGLVVTFEPVK